MLANRDKTKEQLINELDGLRQQIVELEASETGRKGVEEKLRQSERKFRVAVKNNPDFIVFVKRDGTIFDVNHLVKGFTREMVINQSIFNENWYATKEQTEVARKQIEHVFRTGKSGSYEYAQMAPDGSLSFYETRVAPFERDSEGSTLSIQCATRDITERKRAEEALWESEERYRQLVELSPDTIAIHSEGKIVFINTAGAKLLGAANPEQLIGQPIMDFLHPDYRHNVKERIRRISVEEKEAPLMEEKFIRLDGAVIDVEVVAIPFIYQGKPAVQAIVRDITERKRAEEAINREKLLSDSIVDNTPAGIAFLDNDFILRKCNHTYDEFIRTYTPYTGEQALGMSYFDYAAGSRPQVEEWFQKVRDTGQVDTRYGFKLVLKHDGQEKTTYWDTSVAPVLDMEGKAKGILILTQDVTERKRAEEALSHERDLMQALFENHPDFFYFKDSEARFHRVSKRFCDFFGLSMENIIGKTDLELFPKEVAEKTYSEDLHIIKTGAPLINKEESAVGVCVLTTKIPWFDKEGNIVGLFGISRDITERKKAEETLREGMERHRAIVEQAAESIVLVDAETGELVEFNDRAYESLGYSREEFGKMKIPAFEVIESAQEVTRHIEKIAKEGSDTFETKHRRKDGEIRDIQVSSRAISIGGRAFIQSIWRDITERKQAEEKLQRSEERYRVIFEDPTLANTYFDTKGILTLVNTKAAQIIGKPVEDIIGKHMKYVYPARSVDMYLARVRHAVETGETVEYTDFIESTDKWFLTRVVPTWDVSGKIMGVQASTRDITERKQAEEKLRESEEKLRRMFESVNDGITVTDLNGVIIDINEKALELGGFGSRSDVIGKSSFESIAPCDQERALWSMRELTQRGVRGREEYTLLRADGSEYPAEISANVLKDATGNVTGFVSIIRDITERKQAEDALRESERKYRTLVENVPQKIFYKDRDSVYISCNNNYARDLKIKPEEITGRTDYEFYPKELAEKYRADDRRIIELEEAESIEERYIQDGQARIVQTFKTPVKDNEGNVVGVLGIFHDITERKQAEEEVARLAKFASENPNPVMRIAQNGTVLYANKASLSLLGVWGCKVGQLLPDYLSQLILDVLGSGLSKYIDVECGEHIFSFMFAPVVEAGYVNLYGRDITEHKQAEEELRESEERYRALVSLGGEVGEAVVMLQDTEQGDAIQSFVSDQWPRITGYSRKELLGMSLFDLVHPEHRWASLERHRRKMSGESIPGLFEMSIIRKDGTEVPIELTSAYTTYQGERANVAFIRDITKRKRAEEREKNLQQELELSTRLAAVGELAAGVAHEINNPLTGIIGFSERLLRKSTEEGARQNLEIIRNEARRAAKVIENLLTFARRRETKREPADINEILGRTLELRAYELRTSNIELVVELTPGIPQAIVDFHQIQEVFLNIILNAEQAMTEVVRGGKLSIKTEQVEDGIRISFADDGPGIPAEHRDKLFDPFFTTRGERGGTGLGLSVCHGIVTEHGGRIYAESEPGRGTTFVVELPVTTEEINKGKIAKE